MSDALSSTLEACLLRVPQPEALKFAFACACAERVRHLLEDETAIRCLDTLAAYVEGRADRGALDRAASEAAALANHHQGSRSLDGVGHAAVSASYAVANALAGKAVQAADYAAYAVVYGGGGYGAVSDPESFAPEKAWQLAKLEQLADMQEKRALGPNLVFVFGTLKEDFPNFATNKGRRIGGAFITAERYPLYLVGERFVPWLMDDVGHGEQVLGEVFEVDEPTLRQMDQLERTVEPDGYRRRLIQVCGLEDEVRLAVHAYLKDRDQLVPSEIRHGPLKEYTREHAALYRRRVAG